MSLGFCLHDADVQVDDYIYTNNCSCKPMVNAGNGPCVVMLFMSKQ